MRVLILVALVLAALGLVAAIVSAHTVFGMGTDGWIAASLVAFFLDALLGGPSLKSQ